MIVLPNLFVCLCAWRLGYPAKSSCASQIFLERLSAEQAGGIYSASTPAGPAVPNRFTHIGSFTDAVRGTMRTEVRAPVSSGCAGLHILRAEFCRPADGRRRNWPAEHGDHTEMKLENVVQNGSTDAEGRDQRRRLPAVVLFLRHSAYSAGRTHSCGGKSVRSPLAFEA